MRNEDKRKREEERKHELMSRSVTLERRAPQLEASQTKQTRIEEGLRQRSQRWQSIFNFSPDVIAVTDLKGKITECNSKAVRLFGFSRSKDLIGRNAFELISPEDRQRVRAKMDQTLTQGSVDGAEYTLLKRDDSEFPAEISGGVIRDLLGKPTSFIVVIKDITERKKAGEALRESEENLRNILSSSPDAITVTNVEGKILECNKATLDLHGFSTKQELMGRSAFDLIAPKDQKRAAKDMEKTLKDGFIRNVEYTFLTKDGSEFPAELSASPIRDSSGKPTCFVAITKDITERKKAGKRIQEQIEFLNVIKESLTHPFYVIDANDYTVKLANSAARLGKLAKTSTCYALTHREDSPCKGENTCPLAEVKRTKKPAVVEHIHYDKDGNERIVEIHGYPVLDSEGNVVQMIEYVLDVTERKKAERKMEVLSRFPSENPNPVLRLAMNGRVLYANDAGTKVFKAEVGKKMPERYLPILKKAASSGQHVSFEERVGGRYFSSEVRFIVKANYCNMYSRDITERKEAEKIIEKSAREWQTTFDAIGDAVFLTDLKGQILRCNEAMAKFLGKPFREIVGRTCWELVHGTSKPVEGCPVLYMQKSHRREMMVLPVDERYFDITADPVLDEADNLMGAVHTMTDITEGKKVQIALESEKRHLEALFKSVPQGIVTAGLNHEVIDINPAFTEIFGYCLEEIKGKDVDEILAPKEKLHEARRITQEYDRGKISTVETYRMRQDGNLIPVEISGAPIIIDGKQIGVYTIYRDISERKKAQKKLQNLSEFRESVIENASVWLNVLDAESNVVIWNKAAERISGYSRKEVLRHDKIWEWLYPDEEYRKEILETVSAIVEKGKVAEDSETRIRCKDGQTRMISWNSRNLLDEEGNPIGSIALGRDITDRKKAEAKVQRTLGKLRRTLRAAIQAMVMTVEMRDAYTAGHQRRVTNLASAIAKEMHLSGDEVDGIRMAGSIHDIGKIGVPAEILNKPVRLADMEFELIKTHPAIGYNILKEIKFPWPVAKIVLQHHERIDGSGYPHGLSGDDILIEARILGVADVVEALASHRPYRPALGINKALEEVREKRGILYDPEVVDACLKLFTEKGFKFE